MLIYKNNFPQFLQSICIGPNPDFLKNNTTYCDVGTDFPLEVDLMYDWKNLKKSSDPMRSLRDFCKKFIVYGRDLDVEMINFFVLKVNNFPDKYSSEVKDEVLLSFDAAGRIYTEELDDDSGSKPLEANYITFGVSLHLDNKFLNKLASMLRSCNSPCNYFSPPSDSIGTLFDFGMAMSDSSYSLMDIGKDILQTPINIATDTWNKIVPEFRDEFNKLKVAGSALAKNGVAPFFSEEDRKRMESNLESGITPDMLGITMPLNGDTKTYQSVSEVHTELMAKVKEKLGDCFRMYDHHRRYNPYDNTMNSAFSKRKYLGIRNGDVSSLVDITGSLAPGNYATENTYLKSLDSAVTEDQLKYVDGVKPKKYDSYNSPSGAGAAVVTAGGSGVNLVQASGSEAAPAGQGLENVPTTGKIYKFDFGEVKLTQYGETGDTTPDTGSEIGLGTKGMIVPLKTIAVAPETLDAKMIKYGDVLIITCETKSGETFVERRQVADVSARGLMSKGGYKFLIDEFVPNPNYKSKLANRSKELKLSIQVADTHEPLPKWNPQEASQFAAMFLSKSDWIRVKHYASKPTSEYYKYYLRMETEYRKYCKWQDSDPVNEKWLSQSAKVPSDKWTV